MRAKKFCLKILALLQFVLGVLAILFGVRALREVDSKRPELVYTYKCGLLVITASGLIKVIAATIGLLAVYSKNFQLIGFLTITGLSSTADFCISAVVLYGRTLECISRMEAVMKYGDDCLIVASVSALFQAVFAYCVDKYYTLIDDVMRENEQLNVNASTSSFGSDTSHVFGAFPSATPTRSIFSTQNNEKANEIKRNPPYPASTAKLSSRLLSYLKKKSHLQPAPSIEMRNLSVTEISSASISQPV